MTPEDQLLLRRIITQQHTLSLAVLIDERPYVGLLPFALAEDSRSLLVHASDLARHTKGLVKDAPYSALIHVANTPDANPLAIPRVTVEGIVSVIAKGTVDYQNGQERYVERFPESAPLFQFGDFNLYALMINTARVVAGFGRTFNLSIDRFGDVVKES